ncbi:MAG: ABC transporter permease [Clostridium sp.]|jgi:putative ABC transport system permease protein|nr:ABC transporter permease [Clostridium sp.]
MLIRKMLRDIGRHKMQFTSIFLMSFLALFIYAGVGGEWRGLQKSADDFYGHANLADVWVYGGGFTAEQARDVGLIPGVTSAERRLALTATADLADAPMLELYFAEDGKISAPYIVDGAAFDLADADGIWLAKRFADARGVQIGAAIRVSVPGITLEKTVRGLVYSAEHVYLSGSESMAPDFGAYGYAWLPGAAFPLPAEAPYNVLLIQTDGARNLEDAIGAALGGRYSVYLERADHPSVSMFANEIAQHKMMGDIFPIVFLAIALLTILTTMTRIVTNQRVQIGTLKALGFQKSAVTRHYVCYGLFLALFGGVAGLLTGPLALPPLFYPSMSDFYTLPEWKPTWAAAFLLMTAAFVALCALVTWLAARRLLHDTPAETLRPTAPKSFRHSLITCGKLGFNARWNLRDASRNRARSLMAIIGVFGCAALVVCALAMNDSIKDLKVWQYETVAKYESKLLLSENLSPEQVKSVTAAVSGETIMEGSVEIRYDGVKKSGALLVTDAATLIQPTGLDRKPTELPADGVSMTWKLAETLGIKQGDTVKWHIYGTESWTESLVAEIYREPVNQGITMTREHLESLGLGYRPTAVLTAESVTAELSGVDSVLSKSDSAAGWDDLTETMWIMVYLLIAAAAVLSVVVLYNLGLLSFTEMERELATMKVMGFRTGQLRGLLLTQNLWFSAVGFLLGVPGGLRLTRMIVSFSGDSFDFPVRLHALTLFVSFVFTFGLSVSVNLWFTRKIRRLNMVESLKAME